MLVEHTAPGDGSVALAQEKGRFASAKAALERPAMMASMKVVPEPQEGTHPNERCDHIPELVRHEKLLLQPAVGVTHAWVCERSDRHHTRDFHVARACV